MRNITKTAGAALLGLSVLAAPMAVDAASKATKTGNKAATMAKDSASSKAVEQLALGYKLADWARSNNDAMAMATAAKMVGAIQTKAGSEGKLTAKGKASTDTGAAKTVAAADLFTEAKTLAKGDQDTLDAIGKMESGASKGAIGGPIAVSRWVPGNTDWTINFAARGGEPLIVAARVGGLPVGMQLVDENGYVVCEDTSGDSVIGCRITPAWSGSFSAHVINVGSYGGSITFVSN